MKNKIKTKIATIAEKNRIADRIMDVIQKRDHFLLLAHKDPDTDCIASLVACALLVSKFHKEVTIFMDSPVSAHYSYLLAICRYNGVKIAYGKLPNARSFCTVIILDTPKPEMIAVNDEISALLTDKDVVKVEIDHHVKGDASYAGDEGCCLVSEASSTCELIGYLLLKMSNQKEKFKGIEFFTRNLSLAILTGIIGDSQMGKYLKNRGEKFYYRVFTEIFNELLGDKADKDGKNLSSMEAVFDVIQNFSVRERHCFEGIMELKNTEKSIHYICIDEEKSAELFNNFGTELIVNVSKSAADTLAETCNKLGLVVYYDDPSLSGFVQFRLRRSANYLHADLRTVLTELKIKNGGGHPGAIGFRVNKDEIKDIKKYTADIITRIEEIVGVKSA